MFNLSRKALKLSTAALTVAAVGGGALASTASAQTNPALSQLVLPAKVHLVSVTSLEQQLNQLDLVVLVQPAG